MVTYTRQELFASNNAAVSDGKLQQPLFDAIKDNGICAVTQGCRAGRNCNRLRTIPNTIATRDFRNTDADALRNDITSVCSDMCASTNDRQADELVHVYNTDCLDKHAPWRNVRVRDSTTHPWYDTDIDDARIKKRKQVNVWRRTKVEIHRQLYITARDECIALISARKTDYFRNQLEKVSNKNRFRLLRSLDGQRVQQQTEFRLAAQECELFSRFFRGKIDNLLLGLQYFNDIDRPSDELPCFTDCIDISNNEHRDHSDM